MQQVWSAAHVPVGIVPPPPASGTGVVVPKHSLWQLLISHEVSALLAVMHAAVCFDWQPW